MDTNAPFRICSGCNAPAASESTWRDGIICVRDGIVRGRRKLPRGSVGGSGMFFTRRAAAGLSPSPARFMRHRRLLFPSSPLVWYYYTTIFPFCQGIMRKKWILSIIEYIGDKPEYAVVFVRMVDVVVDCGEVILIFVVIVDFQQFKAKRI